MKINVKTRIKYKGEEYSSVEELPPEARSAYDKAMAGGGGTSVSSKIVFNADFGSSNFLLHSSDVTREFGVLFS